MAHGPDVSRNLDKACIFQLLHARLNVGQRKVRKVCVELLEQLRHDHGNLLKASRALPQNQAVYRLSLGWRCRPHLGDFLRSRLELFGFSDGDHLRAGTGLGCEA